MRNRLSTSFSHLFGAAAKGAAEDEDERKDARRAEEDEDDKDGAAEDERDEKSAQDEDERGDDKTDGKRGKKARRAEDEDDDADAEDDKDEDAKAARGRERSRCMAIFATKAAGKRPDMAAHFAFNTSLTRREAIDALEATVAGMPAARSSSLDQRMDGFVQHRASADAPRPNRQQAIASSWDAAGKRAGIGR